MAQRLLSSRFFAELDTLEARTADAETEREAALRRLFASQGAASHSAQALFWEDFLVSDQEYRAAIGQLARFCRANRERRGAVRRDEPSLDGGAPARGRW